MVCKLKQNCIHVKKSHVYEMQCYYNTNSTLATVTSDILYTWSVIVTILYEFMCSYHCGCNISLNWPLNFTCRRSIGCTYTRLLLVHLIDLFKTLVTVVINWHSAIENKWPVEHDLWSNQLSILLGLYLNYLLIHISSVSTVCLASDTRILIFCQLIRENWWLATDHDNNYQED